MRLLQTNLNHSRGAQDLLVHTLREWEVGLAVVAEPYSVPTHSNWLGDECGSVAIVWGGVENSPACSPLSKGEGFVAAQWGDIVVVACYAPPRWRLADFDRFLGEVGAVVVSHLPRPVMVLGDFNAHSVVWGSPRTDARGGVILDWAAGAGLDLLNSGSAHTCVRWQGASVVDLSWATPAAARRVTGWQVLEGVETLSDHLYISMEVSTTQGRGAPGARRHVGQPPRWALRRLDEDALMAAVTVAAWSADARTGPIDAGEGSRWFRMAMTDACNVAMPRTRPLPCRAAYWWSQEIADLRAECQAARRQYARARRRRRQDETVTAQLHEAYKAKKLGLKLAIKGAKARAWKELLETLERDPWGRPYRVVMGRLRPWVPPVTEALDPQVLERVVDGLFPSSGGGPPQPGGSADHPLWSAELGVSEEELRDAVRKMGARNTAPGPDGIPGRVLALALGVLGPRLRELFDSCLRAGQFPPLWKRGRLVLLKKEGRPADSPSAYRPICLLDEVGKLFERILAARLVGHLSGVGPDISEEQFGFRKGRSTIDAISRVRALAEAAVSQGGVALGVSLDITNALSGPTFRTGGSYTPLVAVRGRRGKWCAGSRRGRFLGRSCGTSRMTRSCGSPSPPASASPATQMIHWCWRPGVEGPTARGWSVLRS
ncbi:Retrovirus-related Pol polyprotein from type-1 retrotransposable element R1 (Fragment) [Anthophora retusa]